MQIRETKTVSPEETARQLENCETVARLLPEKKYVYIRTFGCQQNVSDSERIAGMLKEAGYNYITEPEDADLIIFNTCLLKI